jgi:hypothetical protein
MPATVALLHAIVALASVLAMGGDALHAQVVRYIDGVFVAPKGASAPIELIAYAESLSTGILRMQYGSLEDAPLVHEIAGAMVSVPNWKPVGAFVGTTELFRDDRAERRRLSIAAQQRNVYAVALRIVDLERRERIEALLRSVRASADAPGYAFIAIASGEHVKYYPVRLTPLESQTKH